MLTPLELKREYPYPTHLLLRVTSATAAILVPVMLLVFSKSSSRHFLLGRTMRLVADGADPSATNSTNSTNSTQTPNTHICCDTRRQLVNMLLHCLCFHMCPCVRVPHPQHNSSSL